MPALDKLRARSAGYRIGRIFRAVAKLGDRLFPPTGVNRCQVPIFLEVFHAPGRSQKQLSTELNLDTAAIARTLQALEKAGMVERRENPLCRRDKCVFPTAHGETLLPELLRTLSQYNEILFQGFTESERRNALGLLDRIERNVQQALNKETQ